MYLLCMILSNLLAIKVIVRLQELQFCSLGTHVEVYAAIWLVWRLQSIQNIYVIESEVVFQGHIVKLGALLVAKAEFARLVELMDEFALGNEINNLELTNLVSFLYDGQVALERLKLNNFDTVLGLDKICYVFGKYQAHLFIASLL